MNSIEVFLQDQQFDEVKISVNHQLIAQNQKCHSLKIEVDSLLPVNVDVEFWPFKIRPIIRYNDVMLDYWLADVLLQDHKLSLTITDDFFERYRNKNIQGRINSLTTSQRNSENFLDQHVGVNNGYPEIVSEIKNLLS